METAILSALGALAVTLIINKIKNSISEKQAKELIESAAKDMKIELLEAIGEISTDNIEYREKFVQKENLKDAIRSEVIKMKTDGELE